MEKDGGFLQVATERLRGGEWCHEIDRLSRQGLEIVLIKKGMIRCNFVLPRHLSDVNGNWHAGAVASLIDIVAAAAITSVTGTINVTVDFNISYFSTVKINEEVEIEAKVVGNQGKFVSVTVEIRRKDNGELVVSAKQWTVLTKLSPAMTPPSKL
ncbi:PREDICTED: uncharacterized protein LOC104592142 [Nelumbo nucifera]|uniref:Acyl-coenzyme A thioesterase 13 n=1 Tax=Nelumbo nucifera TaxID=4432 RepID=A0A1U7ZAK2_NELNU|nr:PREDICTED: uncharacterized protein LOC104592142 [Nelumbo nucifera]